MILKRNRAIAPVKYALRAISLGVSGDCAGRSQNLVMLDIKLAPNSPLRAAVTALAAPAKHVVVQTEPAAKGEGAPGWHRCAM